MPTDHDLRNAGPDGSRDSAVTIEVTKSYEGDEGYITALNNVNLEVSSGEFVSIVGPSGCGKSTLLHIVAGILSPTEGHVNINGINVASSRHQRDSVGLVFQSPVLLEWRTVLENVLLPVQIMSKNGLLERDNDWYRGEAQRLLKLVGLEDFVEAYPRELSGGMQQRVSICQALIYEPEVLLMDEPFGSLDALTKRELNREFLSIWNEHKKTVLFVTHDLEEAAFMSDRIVILTPRPGEIRDILEVGIERPRTTDIRTTDEFQQTVSEAMTYFKDQQ